MNNNQPSFLALAAKTIVAHSVTYFFMGILASTFLNYAERFARPEMACWCVKVAHTASLHTNLKNGIVS